MTDDQLNDLLEGWHPPEPSPELEAAVRQAWRRLELAAPTQPWWLRPVQIPAWVFVFTAIVICLWVFRPVHSDFALSNFKPIAEPVVEVIPAGGNGAPSMVR